LVGTSTRLALFLYDGQGRRVKTVIGEVTTHYYYAGSRLIDFYLGNPAALLANRRRKLEQARALRKQENVKLRQRMILWPKDKTVGIPLRLANTSRQNTYLTSVGITES